jgi:hypothetical protein
MFHFGMTEKRAYVAGLYLLFGIVCIWLGFRTRQFYTGALGHGMRPASTWIGCIIVVGAGVLLIWRGVMHWLLLTGDLIKMSVMKWSKISFLSRLGCVSTCSPSSFGLPTYLHNTGLARC